jgi:uncharacterized protein (DUF2147 family)
MLRSTVAIVLAVSGASSMAQMSPVGLWRTISDKDGVAQSEVRIVDTAGIVSGKVEKITDPKAKPGEKCVECTDERKDLPILGLEILRGLKKIDGKDVWDGGTVVEPATGKIYRAKVTPIEGGAKLEMRGYIGSPLFGRTATWIRIQ